MTAIEAATNWLLALLAGSIVTSLLTVAVAAFGIAMLFGNLSVRRGLELVVGCFVLVGAAEISRSMIDRIPSSTVPALSSTAVRIDDSALPPLGPDPVTAPASGNPFDPYAGQKSVN